MHLSRDDEYNVRQTARGNIEHAIETLATIAESSDVPRDRRILSVSVSISRNHEIMLTVKSETKVFLRNEDNI